MHIANTLIIALMFALLSLAPIAHAQQYSTLWGEHGEKWSPKGRLPDFSFAGYHSGESALPTIKVVANVRDFGAKGDGEHDDTQAFLEAIKATTSGAILIPEGRYKITQILWIEKPNIVLRGEGPEKTTLFFPKPLEELRPNPSATTEGRATSGYSWSGGLVWIKGTIRGQDIGKIINQPQRGDRDLELDAPPVGMAVGDRVSIELRDDDKKSLISHVYSGDPGDTKEITKPITIKFVSRIAAIRGSTVTTERPLRLEIRKEWQPVLRKFEATVSECGVEQLAIAFPSTPYKGHFTEVGYNGIAINGAADCWVRNVRLSNCDSGIFAAGLFCTVDGVVIESDREAKGGMTGHHGLSPGTDCLITNFNIKTRFIHDITVSSLQAGAVVKNGRGNDICLDHHKRGPFENLFANIDMGEGSAIWRCGGGASLGKNCAARGTFWNLKSKKNQSWPPDHFGPDSMNLIGLTTDQKSILNADGKWFEAIPPAELQPADLHAAQLKKRLEKR